ncbi:LytTR family DNA-binding domain-containing protein [Fodinibius sp.]|uniref:LytR/AlgR family response regulator transcription factor n=1 Tax=Fodinibius sp. TaxID=1872440 RepID=UPI002ACE8E87|nr:LytTR family DNA-binding domain-containing protein [Fodinibius sp.]MDZ7657775.1 LytTR family DNA-binding domain-containing protein [Fodinibius sp.]
MENKQQAEKINGQVEQPYLNRILVKNSDKNIFVDVSEIRWIECSGNYLKLHLPEKSYMIRSSLKNLKSKLNPLQFVRIHRSWMVNINEVKEIEPWFSGDSKVILSDGKTLRMSRNYKDNLEKFTLN